MDDDDDDILPKGVPAMRSRGSVGVSPAMRSVMRATRAVGLLFGGLVALVGVMSIVGLLTDNFWARFLVGVLVVLVVPAFIADRLLRKTSLSGLSFVADVFAIVFLAIALVFVGLGSFSKTVLVREGDRYARGGSRTMARLTYFVAGVTPTFTDLDQAPVVPPATSADAGTGK